MIMEVLEHSLHHALTDSVKLLPFLFVTYLIMEYIEHKIGKNCGRQLQKIDRYGPVLGSVFGILPQCGFSSVASNLYAGKVITLGTLIAVYLATSDEMLPVMISQAVSPWLIVKVLVLKLVVGIISGIVIDHFVRTSHSCETIHEICEQDHCCCEKNGGIVRSAIKHSVSIFIFLFLITLALNVAMECLGEERLAGFVLNRPLIGEALAGIIGLIPNCAASVVLTELFLEGGMSFSALMSGLFTGAGVGLLVLFRENRKQWKENVKILGVLYGIGVAAGWLIALGQSLI